MTMKKITLLASRSLIRCLEGERTLPRIKGIGRTQG